MQYFAEEKQIFVDLVNKGYRLDVIIKIQESAYRTSVRQVSWPGCR